MLPTIMSLVLAIAPTCSLAPRSSVLRPATLAAHTPRTSGTHACVCTQQMQHLDSNQYRDATSRDSPDSWLPWAHVGRSTRGLVGRTPLMLRPSSYGSTSGRGLTSCRMRAPGDTIGYNGVVLPPLPQRPPGARFLLSRSDAGTLTVSLPSRGLEAAIYSFFSMFWVMFCVPEVAVNAVVCASAAWAAARAFTSATLSVGEFQWEYKETFAGVITTRYMQGPVEELDICLQDGQFELITGNKKIFIAGNSQLSEEEANWVFQSISARQSLPRRLSL